MAGHGPAARRAHRIINYVIVINFPLRCRARAYNNSLLLICASAGGSVLNSLPLLDWRPTESEMGSRVVEYVLVAGLVARKQQTGDKTGSHPSEQGTVLLSLCATSSTSTSAQQVAVRDSK